MLNHLRVNKLGIILFYTLFLILSISLLIAFIFPDLLNKDHFLFGDAGHYHWIKNHGYEGFRIAFFPLFPILWKVLSLDLYGISIVNAFLYLGSFYLLAKAYKLDTTEVLLYLSIPSSIFYFLPFTEALFFATSTVIILGYKTENRKLILLGLLLATFTRPAFIFFIPAIFITELMHQKVTKKSALSILWAFCIIAFALLSVFGIHAYYTGNWWSYFEMTKHWGGGILHLPKFPFTSWGSGLVLRPDGAATLVGIFSGILLFAIIFKARFLKNITVPKEIIFSLCYIGGITLFLIFRGGELFSLNRFVFAVPFLMIAFHFWIQLKITFNTKQLIYLFLTIFLFWFLFGSYGHIQTILKFLGLSFYVLLIFVIKHDKVVVRKRATILFICINMSFQLFFFCKFLNGGWIG